MAHKVEIFFKQTILSCMFSAIAVIDLAMQVKKLKKGKKF